MKCAVAFLVLFVAHTAFAQHVSQAALAAASEIQADRIRAHMAFLADDELRGRATGSAGFAAAARYVSEQFRSVGLQPVAGRYEQEITIQHSRVIENETSLTIVRDGTREALRYGDDFVSYGETLTPNVDVDAALVFVGDGITIAHRNIDAYRHLNVRGKICVAMAGGPSSLPESEASFFEEAEKKATNAANHGAVGLLLVEEAHIPWT